MTSAQVVETSVTSNSPSQDYIHPDDHITSINIHSPGFRPFIIIRSTYGRESEKLASFLTKYASCVRQIRQQLWFNHRCKDLGLTPRSLKIKSPLNTREAISIVRSASKRLLNARINDCHKRLNKYKSLLEKTVEKLRQSLPSNLLEVVRTIADKRAYKRALECRTRQVEKLRKLYETSKRLNRPKPDANWVKNISSRQIDDSETKLLSYGLKHSIIPRHVPTETIVAGVEDALSRLDNLTEDAKDDIRSRVASTIQSTPRLESNLSREELRALKRLRNVDTIVILPADKGRVTVVMDKSEYFDKMNHLVEDRKTYKELDSDPTPALARRLNNKLLELEKKKHLNGYQYKRLRCSAPQSPKLYGLPKLHKPQIPMRPIVSFCGSPTYQLSKYLTSILQPLTNASRHKLQSTENFINAIKTIRLPDNYKLVSFDVKSVVYVYRNQRNFSNLSTFFLRGPPET